MDLRIEGKTALITGASTGIGRGIAKTLAAEGAKTVVVGRRRNLLAALAEEISSLEKSPAEVLVTDLTQAQGIGSLLPTLAERGLTVDILVNCAGGSRPLSIDASDEAWDEAMMLNYTMHRKLTHNLIHGMKDRRWGRIINITGTVAPKRSDGAAPAKAAMHSWARGLAGELASDGITINSIVPGRINSEQIATRLHPDKAERDRFIAENIPVGYFGDPEDIASLVAFLASPGARYISGSIIRVDGAMYRLAV